MDNSQNSHPTLADMSPAALLGGTDIPLSLSDHSRHMIPNDREPVRTLFVSGLPADVKNRELYNLFRTFEGFQSATVTYTGERKMPVAFVVFSGQEFALTARERLQGINFDPEVPTTLRIELAKSNSKSKVRKKEPRQEPRQEPGRTPNPSPSIRNRAPPYRLPNNIPDFHVGVPLNDGSEDFFKSQGMFEQNNTNSYPYFPERPQFMPPNSPSRSGQLPCSTLFIGNMSPHTPESELGNIFNNFPGFEKLKISRKGDNLMCFIDFKTVQSSNSAMAALQTMDLIPAEGRRIRIEFARSRMGGQRVPTWS